MRTSKKVEIIIILAGYFIILLFSMIAIGLFGIAGMGSANDGADIIYQKYLSSSYLQSMESNFVEMRRYAQIIAAEEYAADLENNLAMVESIDAAGIEAQANYEISIAIEKELLLYETYADAYDRYRTELGKVIEMAGSGQFDRAAEYQAGAANEAREVQEMLDALKELHQVDARLIRDQSDADFKSYVTTDIIILISVILVAIIYIIAISFTIFKLFKTAPAVTENGR